MRKNSKKLVSVFIALAMVCMPVLSSIISVHAQNEEIVIFHTNDMHGAVENLSYVKAMKDSVPGSILIDAGDATQGSSLATYTEGKAIIELMNAVGYDGMTTGNHEFDYGTAKIVENAKAANFPVVSANVFDKNGGLLFKDINNGNGEYFIIERNGVKIGFFGITTVETAYKTNPAKLDGTTFGPEITYSQEQVAKLKAEGVDVIIGVCHVGIDATSDPTSRKIAKEVPGIDIIIDGHSHSQDQEVIDNGTNKTYIVQTGTKLATVGEIKIDFDTDTKEITTINTALVSTNEYKAYTPDAGYAAIYQAKTGALAPILNEKVTNSTATTFAFDSYGAAGTRVSRLEETPAGDLVADSMRYEGGKILSALGYDYPVVSLQNGGGVRANLPAGEVTVGNILDILPFGNLISIKEITPDILYAALENGYSGIQVTAEGYINTAFANGGFAQISGMRAVVDADQPVGNKVKEIYLQNDDGSEVLLSRSDTTTKIAIVSNDFEIAGGDGYTMLKNLKHIAEGGTLDMILQDYIEVLSNEGSFTYASTKARLTIEQIETIQNTGYLDIQPNITLQPNTNYLVVVDGYTTVPVTTDENGHFVLQQLTNGVHTVGVDGQDYYISSYTNLGILSMDVVAKIDDNPIVEPDVPKVPGGPTGTPNPNGNAGNSINTGDDTAILESLIMLSIAGGYIALNRKRGYK